MGAGRDERVDHFKGVPKNLEQSLGSQGAGGLRESGYNSGIGSGNREHESGHHGGAATASHHHNKESGHPSMVDERVDGRRSSSSSSDEEKRKNKDKNYGEFSHRSDGNHPSGVSQQTSREKPSMMDKLNPKKDADRDGKAGFMS